MGDLARSSRGVWAWLALCAAWGLGCVLETGEPGDEWGEEPTVGERERWREDSEQRQEERDNPRSASYRGSFEVELSGEVAVVLEGSRLGEATFRFVSEDLVGTPPHCQITLADRTPDERGAQGYVIVQYVGSAGCRVPVGEHALYGTWQEAVERGGGSGFVLKSGQVSIETDARSQWFELGSGSGTLVIDRVESGALIQGELDAVFGRKVEDDGAPEAAQVRVRGVFGAVLAP